MTGLVYLFACLQVFFMGEFEYFLENKLVMRKLLLITVLILISFPVLAQDSTKTYERDSYLYAQLLGIGKLFSDKVNVSIDFGQNTTFFEDTRLRDDKGKIVVFNSMVDAMNWMGSQGWEFVQAYVVTVNQQNVYHWLLKLNTNKMSAEQLQQIKGMFKTKKDIVQ